MLSTKKAQKTTELNNLLSFAVGFGIVLFVVAIAFFALPILYAIGVAMITIGYVGFGGIVNIPIGFKGIPLMLGKRIESFVLAEGLVWIMPRPFMNSENVDVKERTSDPGKVTVLTGKKEKTVRVIVDAAIQWKITNPFQVLSVGIDVVAKGMEDLIKEVIRSTMADKTPDEAIQIHEKLKDDLETKATEKSFDWGIEIKNIFITQLGFMEEVVQEFERLTKEEKQRESEATELGHVANQIKVLVEAGLSPTEAKDVVQTERGKVNKTIEEKIYRGLEGAGAIGAVLDNFISKKKGGNQ